MKKLVIVFMAIMMIPSICFAAESLPGPYFIGSRVQINVDSHLFSTGVERNAQAAPFVEVFAGTAGNTVIDSGNMVIQSADSKIGHYILEFSLIDSIYNIDTNYHARVSMTVGGGSGVTANKSYSWRIMPNFLGDTFSTTTDSLEDISNSIISSNTLNIVDGVVEANIKQYNGATRPVEMLELMGDMVFSGRVVAGTLTTTQFTSNITGLTAIDGTSPRRRIVFDRGSTLPMMTTYILIYSQATGLFTVSELPMAPIANDKFMIYYN